MIENEKYQPLALSALSKNDLVIFSTLIQDSIVDLKNIKWLPKNRRFAMMINRFRWEDENIARLENRRFERVQSILVFEGVLTAKARGINQSNSNKFWILMIEASEIIARETQFINVKFAELGEISLQVEYIEVFLRDVSQPFFSNLARLPNHGI